MESEPSALNVGISVVQGILDLTSLGLFFGGLLGHSQAVWTVGGVMLVGLTVLKIWSGALNPLFPSLFAIALAVIIHPWQLGVFWSIGGFGLIGVPYNFRQMFTPVALARRIHGG